MSHTSRRSTVKKSGCQIENWIDVWMGIKLGLRDCLVQPKKQGKMWKDYNFSHFSNNESYSNFDPRSFEQCREKPCKKLAQILLTPHLVVVHRLSIIFYVLFFCLFMSLQWWWCCLTHLYCRCFFFSDVIVSLYIVGGTSIIRLI
jgi:hypothetical protein